MAATSDESMDSLVLDFDRIYLGFKNSLEELQSIKSSYNAEVARSQSLQSSCNHLKEDNERLRRLYNEYLSKFTNQIKYHATCRSLKEELKKAEERRFTLEEELKKKIALIKEDDQQKIHNLEKQISCYLLQQAADQAVITQLQQDLAAHKAEIENLTNNLKHIATDLNEKHHHEMQDLKDWFLVEQEEKSELQKKLQNAEHEVMILKSKQAEQQRESISIRHVETLKQKIMNLRKENESLKRQLKSSERDGA